MNVSIGIACYNEEKNIGNLLSKLVKYPFEIIVVASGCKDKTVEIAKGFNCNVIEQQNREGKASAVNIFLKEAKGDVLVLESADTLPCDFTYKYLLSSFENKSVGMVGAHPIPINDFKSYINKVGHLLWDTHHEMALRFPKAGEVCAFRNIVKEINPKTVVDEVSIEHQVVNQGFKVVYESNAIIFNKAPLNNVDFLKQRERVYLGHLCVRDEGYEVKTMNQLEVLKATLRASKNPFILGYGMYLEFLARMRAFKAYKNKKDKYIWDMIETTKGLK